MLRAEPAYLRLPPGELRARAEASRLHLKARDLCYRQCGIDRNQYLGACRTGTGARVASYGPHFGEEGPLSGWAGSGTIFFARCNLHCVFCQDFDISQRSADHEVSPQALVAITLDLQASGCHNINKQHQPAILGNVTPADFYVGRARRSGHNGKYRTQNAGRGAVAAHALAADGRLTVKHCL